MNIKEIKATAEAVKFSGTISELCELIQTARAEKKNIKVSYCGKTFYSLLDEEYTVYTQATGYSKQDFEKFFEGKEFIDPAVSRKQAREILKGASGQVYPDRKTTFEMIVESFAKIGKIDVSNAIVEGVKLANTKRTDAVQKVREMLSELDEQGAKEALMVIVEYSKRGPEFLREFDPEKAQNQETYLKDLGIRNLMQANSEQAKKAYEEFIRLSKS